MNTLSIILIALLALLCIAALVFLSRTRERAMRAEADADALRQNIAIQQQSNQQIVSNLKESHAAETDSLRGQFAHAHAEQQRQFEQSRADMQRQWEEKLATMRLEFDKLTAEHLRLQQESMKATNRESVENLLTPLRQTIDTFKREFADKMTDTARTDAVLKASISALQQKTDALGASADNLTRALKADPKKQGDWGEAVLRNILEASGMTEGRDFKTQARTVDADGHTDIPDVLVHIPGEGELIIDSKTSIKSYLDYTTTDDEAERQRFLREHIASVRRHYRELSDKHYSKKVRDAAAYVLMFIPNEGSYILAMENDPNLAIDAYREHIIIVNPTNLMLALQIVSLLWQNQRQTKNVRDIMDAATHMYEKFATFSATFVTLGDRLDSVQRSYAEARTQLISGRGNLARQIEEFKKKGIITNKAISPRLLESDDEEEATS